MEGRRVVLFKQRPGADRRLGTARSTFYPQGHTGCGDWWLDKRHGAQEL